MRRGLIRSWAWVLVCASGTAFGQGAKVGPPNSIAAAGDSITQATDATTPYGDHPDLSWSTGTSSSVLSLYRRILANHAGISGHTLNVSVAGSQMADLPGQVQSILAAADKPDYVTVLMGANDACTGSEGTMTTVADFRAQFAASLSALSLGLPDARIFVSSIPNVYTLWSVLHGDSNARFVWTTAHLCQALLVNPNSTAAADEERRQRVRQRVVDYNTQLREVCAGFIHCRYDNGDVFGLAFTASEVSTLDYFHPSVSGHGRLAGLAEVASFDFGDLTAPHSIATQTAVQPGTNQIRLAAADNLAVSGIEFQINSGPWTRYRFPPLVVASDSFVFRAVDVNGNIEATQTLVFDTQAPTGPLEVEPDGGDGSPPVAGCGCDSTGQVAPLALLLLLAVGLTRRFPG